MELAKGANTVVSGSKIVARLEGVTTGDVDLSLFSVTAADHVRGDSDLVFYNQPEAPDRSVRLTGAREAEINLAVVSTEIRRIVIAATVDDSCPRSFAEMRMRITLTAGGWQVVHLPASVGMERCLMLVELYRRGEQWKVRAVSQGWENGFAALIEHFGIAVGDDSAGDEETPPPTAAPRPPRAAPPPPAPPHPVPLPPASVPPAPARRPLHPEIVSLISTLVSTRAASACQVPHPPLMQPINRRLYRTQRDYAAARRFATNQLTDGLIRYNQDFDRLLEKAGNNPPTTPEAIIDVLRQRNRASKSNGRGWFRAMRSSRNDDVEQTAARVWPALMELRQRAGEPADFEAVQGWLLAVFGAGDHPMLLGRVNTIDAASADRVIIEIEAPGRETVPIYARAKYVSSDDRMEHISRSPTEMSTSVARLFASCALMHASLALNILTAIGHRQRDIVVNVRENAVDPATGQYQAVCRCSCVCDPETLARTNLGMVDPVASINSMGGKVAADSLVAERSAPVGGVGHPTGIALVDLYALSPYEFEDLVCDLIRRMGYSDAQPTSKSGDGGIDVIATSTDPVVSGKVVISVKRHRNTVSPSHVRELDSVVLRNGAIKGLLVTTSKFGPASYEFIRDKNLDLIDGHRLRQWLQDYMSVSAR